MLDKIKTLLGISLSDTSKDAILALLIAQAMEFAINYTHNENIGTDCENSIISMVVWGYHSLDNIGINSESYSGVSFSYAGDYPEPLLRTLKANRKVMTL